MEPFILKGVEAKYPRIDQPYHFSNKDQRSVPCNVEDENAAFDLTAVCTPEQVTELWGLMQQAWKEGRDASWPESIEPPFAKTDDGRYEVKTRRKATYGAPLQRFADNSEAPADFKLTSGSVINVAVQFVPYKMRDHGVSLRLMGVQVLKYIPYKPPSPFDAQDGYTGEPTAALTDNPFAPVGIDSKTQTNDEWVADFDKRDRELTGATVEPSSNFSF